MAGSPFRTLSPLNILTLCLWGEGRGEPVEGRLAIGCVIRNRVDTRKQDYASVILAPSQFSCFAPAGGAANYDAVLKAATTPPMDTIWIETQWIASGVLTRVVRDITGGADHYLTTKLYHEKPPAWATGMTVTAVIGRHTFLR